GRPNRGIPRLPSKAEFVIALSRESPAGFRTCERLGAYARFPTCRCFPGHQSQCFEATFVLTYRCGAVPESHRVPLSAVDGSTAPATRATLVGVARDVNHVLIENDFQIC